MKKRAETMEEPIGGVNIVPIIDVTLVLLVILLLMSPILNQPTLPVELPEAMTKEAKDQNITLNLALDGRISIDKENVTWETLPQVLKRKLLEKETAVVLVRADKEHNYGTVETFLRTVGAHSGNHAVAIATKQRDIPIQAQ